MAHLFEVHFPGSELTGQEENQREEKNLTATRQDNWSTAVRVVIPSRIEREIDN